MHRFQLVSFNPGEHAQQLIVGNSGVKLGKQHRKNTTVLQIDKQQATVMGSDQFGYMLLQLGGKGWCGKLLGTQGKLLKCDSNKYPDCKK